MVRRALPYVVTLGAVALLTVAKLAYDPLGRQLPFLLYFAVVLSAAWYGGRGPGMFASLLSALAANYFFLEPAYTLSWSATRVLQTAVFLAEVFGMVMLTELIRTQRARAVEASAAQTEERATSLAREISLRNRLEALSAAAEQLSTALTRDEVARLVVDRGTTAMSADTTTMYVVDASGALELVGDQGVAPEIINRIRRLTSEDANPTFAMFASGEAMWVENHAEYVEKMPTFANVPSKGPRVEAFWSVPLIVEGKAVGLLGMGFRRPRTFPPEERAFIHTFARQCAQALVRAERLASITAARRTAEEAQASLVRSLEEQKEGEVRRLLVSDVTSTLATSLDYEATLARLCALLVPRLADWCAIEMIDGASGKSDQLAVAHADPKMVEYAWELRRRYPPKPDAPSGVPNVLRTGKSELYPEITDEMIALGAVDEEHLRISRELRLRSALIVPLVARGATLGAITMVYDASSGRLFDHDDLVIAEEIARRAAIAVDNARLYAGEQLARGAADEANRLKDEFLATVSHELRTPLNAILGWARMINGGEMEEAKRGRALDTIERNAVAMAQLIDDLLDVSRIISGKMRVEVELLDMTRVVDAAIESVKPAALAKAIRIRALHEPFSDMVLGDPNRIQQVVWNLLSNAVKFTPRGGKVDVVIRKSGSSVELSVSDSGAGIDPAFIPFVFDRFRQADGKITRTHGGLGLGLSITRHLVELHGGTVQAESEGGGRGATFTVKLPITAVRQLSERTPRPVLDPRMPVERAPAELAGLHVLAVDDDPDSLRLVQTVLEQAGSRVTIAGSVVDAMRAFELEIPQVVVSDIGMPGDDGFELMRRIRALPADQGGRVPAAALTAYARAIDRTKVLGAGYMIHLAKPIEPAELLAVVASLARFS